VLAKEKYGIRGRELANQDAVFVPFTAQTRMSGVDLDGREIRKGAADSIEKYVTGNGGLVSPELWPIVDRIARSGGTPLVVAERSRALGVVPEAIGSASSTTKAEHIKTWRIAARARRARDALTSANTVVTVTLTRIDAASELLTARMTSIVSLMKGFMTAASFVSVPDRFLP
jgi:hypothetical protein